MNEENGVSRRNAIALAGVGVAGLALAGCSKGSGGGDPVLTEREVSDRVSTFIADRGLDNHGDNPNEAPVSQPQPTVFQPQFMVLIHIKSDGAWAISANHAHFNYTASYDKVDRTKRARDIFLNKLTKGHGRFKQEPRQSNFQVYDRRPTASAADFADELDFTLFQFGSQHDIYVFYEHNQNAISFDDTNRRYLTFSKFFKDGSPANRNHAFFNAERITDVSTLGGLNGKGSLIRLENHMTYKEPVDPTATQPTPGALYRPIPMGTQNHQRYKMNLIYVTRSGLVMMIDPDTGNGVGYDPMVI